MNEVILVVISLFWLIYASYQDFKKHEVDDWVSYSLIIIALAFYLIKSFALNDISLMLQSLFGLGAFSLVGNLMYYLRQWGGGDVKILAGLGALFPLYPKELLNYFDPNLNIPFLLIIILNLIIFGALYSMGYSIYLVIKNKDKLKFNFKINKIHFITVMFVFALSFFIGDLTLKLLVLFLSLIILFYPYVKNFILLIEKNIMIKKISVSKLTEGDWIIRNIYHKGKLIYNKNNPGVSILDINLFKKYKIKNVVVKEGLPFIPSFLLSLISSLILGNLLRI